MSGRLTHDGKPVFLARIQFIPEPGSPAAVGSHVPYALTDRDGRFAVTTFRPGDGAFVGAYKITVFKQGEIKISDEVRKKYPNATFEQLVMMDNARLKKPRKEISLLPEIFAGAETTPLRIDVPRGGNRNLDLDLKNQ